MPHDFHVVNIVNQIDRVPYGVNLIVPPDDMSNYVLPPETDANGKFNLVMVQPSDSTRHQSLGMFMDAWSKLEIAISQLLQELLKTAPENMPVLMNSLGARGQLDVLSVLGQSALPAERASELVGIVESIQTNNTRRNHIVHGYWMLEILIRDHGGKPALVNRQYRAYGPSDPETQTKLLDRRNRKERLKYLFSIPRIDSITRETGRIMRRIWTLRTSLQESERAKD